MPLTCETMMLVVGLMLGTRLWYAMWDAENDDDAAFERRLDSVVREIGDRGKALLPEAVTPSRQPTPAPAPALASATAPTPAPTTARTPDPAPTPAPTTSMAPTTSAHVRSLPHALATATVKSPQTTRSSTTCSPSGQPELPPAPFMTQTLAPSGGSVETIVACLGEQQDKLIALLREERATAERLVREERATAERQRQEMEAKVERAEAEAAQASARAARVCKVASLQVRLEALCDAKLLEDDELSTIEDQLADAIGAAETEDSTWEGVMQMIKLSEGIASEKMFARQLRRKFV